MMLHITPARVVLGCLVALWTMYAMMVILMFPVNAHDAIPTAAMPNGWSYPTSCCGGYDCKEVPDKAIGETNLGYRYNRTGEIMAYQGDARLRDSPDGEFHLCTVGGFVDGKMLCLFVPPRGF